METSEEISSIRDCIVRLYQPDKIILFGSREKHLPRYKRGLDVRLQLTEIKTPKDILFYTHEDVDRWKGSPQSFISTVLSEGAVLYER